MVNYREILRLATELGTSTNRMESILHCSHHTIKSVLDAADQVGLKWPLDESLTNEKLKDILFPERQKKEICIYKMPDFNYIHAELAKPVTNLSLLHSEYRDKCHEQGEIPYSYTQYCEKYRKWARLTKATMRIQHKPGDVMEVDWAGNTLAVYDSVTGDITEEYLFVAVLPCSRYAYVELCRDMKQENWILCHVHAYAYFCGVTRLLNPDNLKMGIISNTRYETILNRSYQDMAEYYGTAIVPARVEHPKDQSHAESTVNYAETWILASLRNEHFFTFEEAREAVKLKLNEQNDIPFKKRPGNRKSAFEAEEKQYLKPLPQLPYEPAVWTAEMLVGVDYLITDGMNKYSVPFDLIGEKVVARLTRDTVEIFHQGSKVASHMRQHIAMRDPIVKKEHMPPSHQKYLEYNSDDFKVWANSVGSNASKAVNYFLSNGKEPEQGYKYCAILRKLADRYGNCRLENACIRMFAFTDTASIRTLTTILKNGHDRLHEHNDAVQIADEPSHGITRGADYYRKTKGGSLK